MSAARYAAAAAGPSSGPVRRFLEGPIVQVGARLFLAGLFLWAAIPKIGNPAGFAQDIANYRILPGMFVHPLAVTLPWVELLAAVLLLVGLWTRAAALVCTTLLAVFTSGVAAAVVRGLDIECGCFGQTGGPGVGWDTVARDVAYLVPAVLVLIFDRGRYGLAALWRRG